MNESCNVSSTFRVPEWKWRRQKAYRIMDELRVLLGEKCAKCGGTKQLEFDCIIPQGDKHHKVEPNRRAFFYRRQYKAGNLQLLCRFPCHHQKSAGEHPSQTSEPETSF